MTVLKCENLALYVIGHVHDLSRAEVYECLVKDKMKKKRLFFKL